MKYTICIVAHETDYDALCFQAQSFSKYLSRLLVEQIIIIENPKLSDHRKLKQQYGRLKDLVQIIPGEALAPSEAFRWTGWWSQQILKLMVADIVKTERYVCLDAKNTLVFPLKRNFLEKNGKPRSFHVDYTDHSSLRWLKHSLGYFNLPDVCAKSFVPTVTPFVMITKAVLELIDHVEAREGMSFATAFLDHQLTEFFLYASFMLARGRLDYDFSGQECHTVWDVLHDDEYVHERIIRTELYRLPFFSVHRRAVPMLSKQACQEIGNFFARRGLLVIGADERS